MGHLAAILPAGLFAVSPARQGRYTGAGCLEKEYQYGQCSRRRRAMG